MPTKVQSVLFDKKKFTQTSAKRWLKLHNFKAVFHNKPVDITKNLLRYRQLKPKSNGNYRIIKIRDGIQFVIEI